jgi:hypothetical protein
MPPYRQRIYARVKVCSAGIGFMRNPNGNPVAAFQSVSERQLTAYFECTAKTVPLFIFPIGPGITLASINHLDLSAYRADKPPPRKTSPLECASAVAVRATSNLPAHKKGMTVFQRCLWAVGREIFGKMSMSYSYDQFLRCYRNAAGCNHARYNGQMQCCFHWPDTFALGGAINNLIQFER